MPTEQDDHRSAEPAAPRITWDNTIRGMFTQLDVGCMRAVELFEPPLDLASYQSVVVYRMNIYYALKSGRMPPTGPRWSDDKLEVFRKWMDQEPPPEH